MNDREYKRDIFEETDNITSIGITEYEMLGRDSKRQVEIQV